MKSFWRLAFETFKIRVLSRVGESIREFLGTECPVSNLVVVWLGCHPQDVLDAN